MDVKLRPGAPEDAEACGRICYDAFAAVAAAHNMTSDLPSREMATGLVSSLLARPGIFAVVAESGGVVVGSNFLDERGVIAGVGPVTVDPAVQNAAVGRRLMVAVMERAAAGESAGVRLVQAAYHTRSLALYARLGFEAREPLACLQGPPVGVVPEGRTVRVATGAALGPALLRVAGELADGTLTWMAAPTVVGDRIAPSITAAAEAAGRPPPRVGVGLPVAVTDDVDAALERAAGTYAVYGTLPSYRRLLDEAGLDGPAGVVIAGDEDGVARRIRALGDLGTTELLASPVGSREVRQRTLRLLGDLARSARAS